MGDLDILKQQVKEGSLHFRIEGTTSDGKVARWVELKGKPTKDAASWRFEVIMGDGTHYDKVVPIERAVDEAMALFLKLKAAFANRTKHGVS